MVSFFDKAERSLAGQGYFFLSTWGKNNFKEIRSLTKSGLNYLDAEDFETILSKKFEIIHLSEEEVVLNFSSAIEMLQHLKKTGVNAASRGKSKLNDFCAEYDNEFGKGAKVRLTYHPIYIGLRKRT